MSDEQREEVRIDEVGSARIYTPEGLVYISRLPSIGTQVMVYDDTESNPVAMVHMDEHSDEFFEVLAFTKPYHPSANPFMTTYARNRKDRDRLIERFERDNLEVRINPMKFYRKKNLNAS